MLRVVGYSGYSWSSSIPLSAELNYRGLYLDFNYGVISRNGSNHRTYGFQTRCLQE
ncbi:MAG: hypothetical protein K2G93_07950 [Rikenella sp.]|nr:hypothetical protein [Rikenella sp.]